MAWVEKRGKSFRTVWEQPGGAGRQSLTWPDEPHAVFAKSLVDTSGNTLSEAECYERVTGRPFPRTAAGPAKLLLREYAHIVVRRKRAAEEIDEGCMNTYLRQLDSVILPLIGHVPLDEVTADHVLEVINSLRGRGLRNSTITRYYSILFTVLQAATSDPKVRLPYNPAKMSGFKRGRPDADGGRRRPEEKAQEFDEFELILAHAKDDALLVIEFLLETGARISEACALQVGDLNFSQETVTIRRNFKSDQKTGRVTLGLTKTEDHRTLRITSELSTALRELCEGRDLTEFVFQSPRGKQLRYSNFYHRRWLPAVRAAGRCADHPPAPSEIISTCRCKGILKRVPDIHSIRHSYATWAIKGGRSAALVAADLGHKGTRMVNEIYAHLQNVDDVGRVEVVKIMRSRTGAGRRRRNQTEATV